MSRSRVFEWFARFRDGREVTDDDEKCGRPRSSRTDENVERVQALVRSDRRMTIEMIAESLNMSVGSVFTIMTEDLKKKKLCARFVPHTLTTEQKEHRIASSEDLIAAADEDPNFLKTIVTGDESWCLEYDPETKRQSSEWTSPGKGRPMKVRASKSKTKTMLLVFFDSRGIIHHEFLRQGSTVTGAFYKDVLHRLLKRMRRS
ncbi:histone-lysine N-methyltransferase SETMAR [Nephila pilipes]|uniref:Histone-lysine N-methyltransferase SETMAR n=3 Tax=Nephila pilipes TaxID=299642 RepID=A0A8X6MQX6_NEPPI|nr:histone-lysine N-methyltransferase SETMAR [Nephila pilipes]